MDEFTTQVLDTPRIFQLSVSRGVLKQVHYTHTLKHLAYIGTEEFRDEQLYPVINDWMGFRPLPDGFLSINDVFSSELWNIGTNTFGQEWDWKNDKILGEALRITLDKYRIGTL